MSMRNTFKILFYAKKNAPLRNGNIPIMGRITLNGERTQISTRQSVPLKLWNASLGRAVGRSSQALLVNEQLDRIHYRIEHCYHMLLCEQVPVTPCMIKERYWGIDQRKHGLLDFFRRHNDEFFRMVGISRSKTTYYKYRSVYRHLERFIPEHYGCNDIHFKEIDRKFLADFHRYMMLECNRKKNTTWVYMIAFKHILMLAREHGYMDRNPFADYKLSCESVARNYLSMPELRSIIRLRPESPTLQLIRDAFLFSCFTGLSYIDLRRLTPRHLQRTRDCLWIHTFRQKTGVPVHIRLFDVACAIVRKYLPEECDRRIFDLPTNGWCNACLERLMAMAGISRRITFHAARHTFATTITLSQGMAIETISELLGHKSVRTTQIYAKITLSKLERDMMLLSKKIDRLYQNPVTVEF